MAHNIYVDKNNVAHAAYAIKPAWHNLGVVVDHLMTAAETMKAAGLDWQVEKRQLSWVPKKGNALLVDAYGVFRKTDDEMLGVVTDFYKPIQNADGFKNVDMLLESVEGAHYEAAGALGSGEKIWCLARVPLELKIKGTDDKSEVYLLCMTRHDGKGSMIVKIVTTRVVCQNTLDIALSEGGQFFRVGHFGDVNKKMKAARDLMSDITGQLRSLEEKMNILAQRKVTKETFLAVMDKLFPPSETELAQRSAAQKAHSTMRDNKLAEIAGLFESNDKNAIPEIKGTAYNLLNSIVEWTDHRAGNDQTRAASAMFGAGHKLKDEALEVIMEATDGAPVNKLLHRTQVATGSSVLDDVVDATSTRKLARARA